MSLQPPLDKRRKLSFPAQLHHNLLGLPERRPPKVSKRRFSTVSDAVSRKLSGWRSNTGEIVAQAKTLCGQYIRCRLKRTNLLNRKCGLQRLRSAVSLPEVREVFPELLSIGLELERMHPSLYTGVGRQASCTPVLTSEAAVTSVLTGVARELSREVTWAKVVSLFAVAGGLAADCVRQGHPELLQTVVESLGQAVDYHMADWIAHHGGWAGLLSYCKPPDNDISLSGFVALLAAALMIFLLLILSLRWLGRISFF
ncbi:bcl-2-related ovarian killer protein homolog B-like [Macrosteles quadrilineatus]|uniref:bcl-2-related ovarian killer protein homolog B-like n=1 Tax=Macrosteles quadrilineatus TaxID=74068 RepID=UPI0023E23E05|nr:bcl-2-related ovarian killer protein homolog B-like [Macrosteles quadrilineatus]XP_054289226.1 bcl-2-related ovarian killer protein homolog B-like [Macrosteles quadrilineatus]